MHTIFLSLGSNLGDRQQYLDAAILALHQLGTIEKISSVHETKAWGKTDQPDFLNLVLKMQTPYEPLEFLQKIQAIEQAFGRVRHEKWGPRTIDIDILLWDDLHLNTPQLTLPHPRMHEREFVLKPLQEVLGRRKIYP